MGANPMQKMKRNSILIGLIIGLVIGGIMCGALYMFLSNNKVLGGAGEEEETIVTAYVLSQDVSSGQEITPNMLVKTQVLESMVPSNYVDMNFLDTIQLQDEYENILYKNSKGELYMTLSNNNEYKKPSDNEYVLIERESDGRYYKTNLTNGKKEYVEFEEVPTVAKINMKKNTILTTDALNKSNEMIKSDLREQEYNMITLPSKLTTGDFVDIRLQLPNGGDYIVVSKKQIQNCDSSTIWLKMNEEEILTMSNAIIEYYIMPGSKLYATLYTEPGNQAKSIPTYCPNSEVVELINGNKNITSQITDGQGRFSQDLKDIRANAINKELNKYSDSALDNIEKNIQQEIKTLKESRESYFGVLNSAN